MSKSSSLADELLELYNTNPKDFNPDMFDAEEAQVVTKFGDNVAVDRTNLVTQNAVPELDQKYKAKVVSRKDFEKEESLSPAEESEEEQESSDGDDGYKNFGLSASEEESDEEEKKLQKELNTISKKADSDEEDQLVSDDEELREALAAEEEEMNENNKADEMSEEELITRNVEKADALEEKLKQENAKDKDLKILVRKDAAQEMEKAVETKNQLQSIDTILDFRIRIQNALSFANTLPNKELFDKIIQSSPDCEKKTKEIQKELDEILTKMKEWRKRLGASGGSGVGVEGLAAWEGRGAPLHALRTPIPTQVAQALQDDTKLVRRTQLVRSGKSIIGKKVADGNKLSKEDNEIAAIEDATERMQQNVQLRDYDENVYDDTDFYSTLLKDLIENGISKDSDELETKFKVAADQARTKRKRVCDTKAKKGKKLRYDVMPPLVHFAAPTDRVPDWKAASQLFGSLFEKDA